MRQVLDIKGLAAHEAFPWSQDQIRDLTQEIGLLRQELEEMKQDE